MLTKATAATQAQDPKLRQKFGKLWAADQLRLRLQVMIAYMEPNLESPQISLLVHLYA